MLNQGRLHNVRFVRMLTILAVFVTLFFITSLLAGETVYRYATDIASPIAALMATWLAIQAYSDKHKDISLATWFGMALGFGLWGIADIIWAFYSIILNIEIPYPSIADLAWLIGYLPLAFALIKRLKTLKVTPTRTQLHFLRTFGAIWLLVTFILIILPIVVTLDAARALEGFVSITYPLADVGLAILSCQVLVLMQKGRFSLAWRLIFAGLLLMAFSDQTYVYATWQGIYYPETGLNLITIFTDITYIVAYLLVALGIYEYRLAWEIKDTFTLNLETRSSAHYFSIIITNQENLVISFSDNFYYLISAKPDTNFSHQPLAQVLGISPAQMQVLNEWITQKDLLIHQPFTIRNIAQQPEGVWVTAQAFYDADQKYDGASFVFASEIPAPETVCLPSNPEMRSMVKYLISLAGSRPQDELQTIRVYFLEMIRLLASMLYHFGGSPFKDAFFAHLSQTIQEQNLPIQLRDDVITISEEYEGDELASCLSTLLQAARIYVCDLIGDHAVNEEIADLERQLAPTAIRDLDKYQLRAFHPVSA